MLNCNSLYNAVLWILPAYIANGAPVITVYLLRRLGKNTHPLDLNKKFLDGKRILGDNKTFEGFMGGLVFGSFAGFIFQLLNFHNIVSAFLLSLGALLGDLMGAFVKRRLNMKPGDPAPLLDQLDFIIGAILLQQLYEPVPLEYILIVVVLTPLIHYATNVVAYKLGLKSRPW